MKRFVQKIGILIKLRSDTVTLFAEKNEINESYVREIQQNEETIRHSVVESVFIFNKRVLSRVMLRPRRPKKP